MTGAEVLFQLGEVRSIPEGLLTMITRINEIVSIFSAVNLDCEANIATQQRRILMAFCVLSEDLYNYCLANLKETETLQEIRKYYNDSLESNNVTGSNFGFANAIKIGYLITKGNSGYIINFANLTALCTALGAFKMVPSCKGIASLEVLPVKEKTIEEQIEKVPNTLGKIELREAVNNAKNIPNRKKSEPVKNTEDDDDTEDNNDTEDTEDTEDYSEPEPVKPEPVKPVKPAECEPVHTEPEYSALALAMVLNKHRSNEDYLLAFARQCFNLKIGLTLLRAFNEVNQSSKTISLRD